MKATEPLDPPGSAGTKRRIIEVAGGLFSQRSYLGVSMSDIADELGISKPALYHHFDSKIQIYDEVLEGAFAELRSRMTEASEEGDPQKRLHRLITTYLDFGMGEKNLINALAIGLSPEDASLRTWVASYRKDLADITRPVVESAGAPWTGADSGFATELLVGLMDGLVIEYTFLGREIDPTKVADQILALLTLGKKAGSRQGVRSAAKKAPSRRS